MSPHPGQGSLPPPVPPPPPPEKSTGVTAQPGLGSTLGPSKASGPNKRVIAAVVILVVIIGGVGAAAMLGAFAGPGQCVLQEVDSQGTVHYTRGENYSPSECDEYCKAHLPPNGGARDCWFDEY